MKKRIVGLFAFVLSFSFLSVPVFASSNSYTLDELGLAVTIPSKYDVVTQDTSPNSSIFSDRGLSGSDIIDQFKANGIYLNALANDGSNEEIVVTMADGVFDNLSEFSNTSLKTLASSLVEGYESYGLTITSYDIYEHSQAKFIRIRFTDTTNSVYGLQYYTNYDAKTINFTLRSYSGDISQNQEETIKCVVDSIVFDTDPLVAPIVSETDSFVYTDKDTNTKFTVPANWYKEELSKDREYIDVKFASGKEEGLVIMYGSTDLWASMSSSDKVGLQRSDFNSSQFTVSDMEEYFGVDAGKVSKATYNGTEYFTAVQSSKQEMYGTSFLVDITRVVRFYNGWLYEFQFGGTKDSDYFSDFEKLLNSVQYTDVGGEPLLDSTPSTDNNKFLIWLGVAIVVSLLVVVVVVKRSKKRNQPNKETPSMKAFDEQTKPPLDLKLRCSNCGNELSPDSLFCHICGTRTNKVAKTKGDDRL